MFFLIPVSTDAPIYHWPFGTVGLIVINTLLFFLLPNPENYMLIHGQGLHPLQWVTSNFIHSGFLHLLGNMIFLWGFGIIVEGKLGWMRFVPVYFAIGIAQCAIEQAVMLGSNGAGSMGASAIIYGLLAITMVWSPRNEVTIFVFVFFLRVIATTFEISILVFGLIYVGKEFLFSMIFGFHFSSEILHLSGAVLGFGVGFLFLNFKWVDCENWDLISVMRNKQGSTGNVRGYEPSSLIPDAQYQLETVTKQKKKKKRSRKKSPDDEFESKAARLENQRAKSLNRIRELLKKNKPNAALSEYRNAKSKLGEFNLTAPDLGQLGDALYRQKLFDEVGSIYEEFISRFSDLADQTRIKLAAIYVEMQQRPRAALRILEPIAPGNLAENLEKTRIKIERKANQLIEEGVLELEGKSW